MTLHTKWWCHDSCSSMSFNMEDQVQSYASPWRWTEWHWDRSFSECSNLLSSTGVRVSDQVALREGTLLNSLVGKNRIVWMWMFIDCCCLKILTLLYIKHLYIAWVADAASFHSCWVSYHLCLSMCVYIIQHLADCFHIQGMSRK
jgi:hypothetical protein